MHERSGRRTTPDAADAATTLPLSVGESLPGMPLPTLKLPVRSAMVPALYTQPRFQQRTAARDKFTD